MTWNSNVRKWSENMSKKDKVVYKEKINWKREAALLPGYLIVLIWIIFTAVFLIWILAASLSTSNEIFSGSVFKFATGFHWENYVNAWTSSNVSVFFGNSPAVFTGNLCCSDPDRSAGCICAVQIYFPGK